MSQSYVPFLDSASATRKFHTNQRSNGADTVEQYIQLEGEPYHASYTVWALSTSLATANSHVLQLMAGASLRVGIRRITVDLLTAAGAATNMAWGVYRLTTAGSGGTAYTPVAHDPADSAAGSTVQTLPTSKGTEGSILRLGTALVNNSATTVGVQRVLTVDWTTSRTKAFWIAAGTSNGLALKNFTAVATAAVYVNVEFVETAEGA